MCVLLGPSGSGKSTLLNIIGGIETADEGYIAVNGEKIRDMNEKTLTMYRRRHLGYVFQMYNLIPNLTVCENIEVGKYLGKNTLDVDELMKTLGIYDQRKKIPSQLSGGQQQRTSIGRAIVKNPDILLCDEPTGALDYATSKEILKLIEDVNKKYGKETANSQAEKYCVTSLDTMDKKFMTDEVMIYGIEDSSKYVNGAFSSGNVLISNAYANKFGVGEGDEITLKEKYSDKTYTFKVSGVYTYDAAIAVFMPRADFNKTFGEDSDYFTGYFSNEELADISDDDIAAVITEKDLTKIVTQMKVSMGEFMNVFKGLAVVIFLLVIYILTKQIIERNSRSVAMTKILGFSDWEIARLYIILTSVIVTLSLLISIPLIHLALKVIFKTYLYTQMTGYIPFIISNMSYVRMFIMGFVSYLFVCIFMLLKIRRMPKGEALKNQAL